MGALDRVFRNRRGASQERPLAAIIAGLWRNGEQGVWCDPSDLSTMYQDAGGSLPVYMPGSGQVDPPVGLWLDKRLGLSKGPELLANGGFDAGAAGWTVTGQDATHIVTFAAGQMRYQSDTTAPALSVSQAGVLTVGKWYFVEVDVAARVSGSMYLTGLTGARGSASVFFSPGVTRMILLANATALGIARNNANVDITLNSISVREIQGNHAHQATTTSRPVLSARYNQFTASEFPGGVTDSVTRGGLISSAALSGYTNSIAFSHDGATSSFIYKAGSVASTVMVISVVVRMDDGLAPVFGSGTTGAANNDFVLVLRGSSVNPTSYITATLGGGYYRVIAMGNVGVGTNDYNGVVKYATNSPRTFKVTAFDLRGAGEGVGLPPYQRVVDANTYDTVGFPLYLRFDGVDDGLTIPGSASAFAFLHNGSGSSVHIGFSPSGGAVYHTLLSSGNLGSGTTVGFSVSQDDRTDGRLLNILNNGSGTLHVSQAAVGGISNARRVVSIVNAVGVHELRQGRTIVSPLAVETGSPSQAAASYDLMIGRAPQAGLPLAGRIFGVIIRAGTPGAAQIVAAEKFLSIKARSY